MSERFEDYNIHLPPNARGDVKALCPECSHTRQRAHQREKCLSVNIDDGVWLCHNCQWSGVLKTDRPIPMRPNLRVKAPVIKPIPPSFTTIGERGLAVFAARGIPADIVQRFGIYSERHYFVDAEGELPALCFPYHVAGELVNVKYRAATAKHFGMVKGARKTFYNLDAVRDAPTVVIVEGEMDVLALATAGVAHAISVPNGANSLTEEVMDSARFLIDRPDVRFILAGDADDKGRALEAELARRFGRERCARVVWPDGCKDANDVLKAFGPQRVSDCVHGASPFPVEGITLARDVEDDVWQLYADGLPRGLGTGWADIDKIYTVRPGEMTLITGEPGSGKSAWTDHLAVHMAILHDWRIGVYSSENRPAARHIAMLMAKWSGAPFGDGPTARMDAETVDAGIGWIHDHFGFIQPSEPTIDCVLDRARTLVYRMGIRGLIIDPWNTLDHTRPGTMTETEYISRCLTRIQDFARNSAVHIWVVAHPTKLIKGANGKYPVATPYDVSGSAHWYNKSDNCISVYRDKDEPGSPTGIYTQKIRFSEVGRIGGAELRYDVPTGRFLDVHHPASEAWGAG